MKAIIIGNSGSGKTWLATQLAVHSGVPVVHLDEIFWQPVGFNEKRSRTLVDQLIADSKQHPSWIVEGVFGELAAKIYGRSGFAPMAGFGLANLSRAATRSWVGEQATHGQRAVGARLERTY
jgi:hypothetical protein